MYIIVFDFIIRLDGRKYCSCVTRMAPMLCKKFVLKACDVISGREKRYKPVVNIIN